jgi:hypothetical protein
MQTIGTRFSGNLEFMNDANSFLIDIDGLEVVQEDWWQLASQHRWASPCVHSLRKQMRLVMSNTNDEATARARKARLDMVAKYVCVCQEPSSHTCSRGLTSCYLQLQHECCGQ